MSLKINQNLGAMNTHQQLQMSESLFNKSMERLSSGLKINRAADDPAGLVLSEKYRAQVAGLSQAISNAKDGVSLVQTAEGALDEVNGILRTMRNLAVHAANTGVNDTASLTADQAQIAKSIETLNRIANTTSFGNKKLLNGSAGVTATTTSANVTFVSGGANVAAGTNTYSVDVSQAAVKGAASSSTALQSQQISGTNTGNAAANAANLTIASSLIEGGSTVISVLAGDTAANIATKINADAKIIAAGFTADASGANFLLSSNRLGAAASVTATASANISAAIAGFTANTTVNSANLAAVGTDRINANEILTFSDGNGTTATYTLTAGQTIASSVTNMQTALDNAGIKLTAAFASNVFTFTNQAAGSSTTVKNSIVSNTAGGTSNSNIGTTALTISAGGGVSGVAGKDIVATLGGNATTGVGDVITGNASTPVDGLKLRVAVGVTGNQGSVTVNQNALEFQIGAFSGETVKVAISDMRANQLGTDASVTYMTSVNVAAIDVTLGTGKGAQDAIKVLDSAISQVSTQRSSMGSFQKDTLEASIRSLGVAKQNMTSTESNIRDADMAEEMLSFSRAQILQQTGMAMLAQANQAPQQVMRLFQ